MIDYLRCCKTSINALWLLLQRAFDSRIGRGMEDGGVLESKLHPLIALAVDVHFYYQHPRCNRRVIKRPIQRLLTFCVLFAKTGELEFHIYTNDKYWIPILLLSNLYAKNSSLVINT